MNISISKDKETLHVVWESKLEVDKVICIESNGDYCYLYTKDQRITFYGTLKDAAKQLSEVGFSRIHRSFIVNKNKIRLVTATCVFLKETPSRLEKKYIPIGRSYKKNLG